MTTPHRKLLTMLVASFALAPLTACGDPEDPAQTNNKNNTSKNNTQNNKNNANNNICGAGKVQASYKNGAARCYTECTSNAQCGAQVCKDADGGSAKICVDDETMQTCGAGEVRASHNGGAERCYKTCTDDDSCGDAAKECGEADGAARTGICVDKAVEPTGPCTPDERFKGQIEGTRAFQGGKYATSDASYAADAGLEALFNFIKAQKDSLTPDNRDTANLNEGINILPAEQQTLISGATVTATWPTRASQIAMFIQDKKRAMVIFVPAAKDANGVTNQYKNAAGETVPIPELTLKGGGAPTFKVGQRINFKPVGVQVFNGTPQIAIIDELEIVSEDQDVYVEDMNGKDFDVNAQWGKMVRVAGRLKNLTMCGTGFRCFDMMHGSDESKMVLFRTNSNFITEATLDKCVTWIGPVGSFPTILSDAPKAQLNTDNYDWARGPFVQQ